MRASLRAGGTSPEAMRCARPSTTAVFPTPARPTSAALFFPCLSRISMTREISASRHRTGSRSPRRACAVRSMPTRSSTSPESNSPSKGFPIYSVAFEKMAIPANDCVTEDERHDGTDSEEYPERHESLLLDGQRNKNKRAQCRAGEHGEQHALPSDETADHRHHLHVAAAHCFFLEDPCSRHPDEPQQYEPDGGTEERLEEAVDATAEREQEADDEPTPGEFVRDDVVARVGDRDAEQQRAE